ncbi:MAG TPA: GNAT family N-acetyltransferase [Nitrososphaeraceae archaeon]|jgi:GNAT superfamily N-acetyltransferase|nr:GNAT family N-acetyltransferase [Nitrososphaeraceae archaeon]
MILKEIEDFHSQEFKESLDIYKSSFPLNETRPVEKVVKMLKEDKDYHLLVSVNNNAVVGISLLYAFRSLQIGLLDYMAVHPNYQRRGIGKKLFEFTLQRLYSQIPFVIGLIMEIQKENVPEPHDHLIRKDRIRFYSELGAKLLDGVNYLLPSQNHGKPEEMYLMIVPLTEMHSLPKCSVIRYVSAIYSTIYQYENKDLLNAVFRDLPTTIMVRDMVI